MQKIVLCSSSQARRALLSRLKLPFEHIAPDIDETPLQNEDAPTLVTRLAKTKAMIYSERYPLALLIGCDQVALIQGEIVGKPTDHDDAVRILTQVSGQVIHFYTGLCLFNTATERYQLSVETYAVSYRQLTQKMIEDYLRAEQPYHCAGSIKVEGLGIALIDSLEGTDPSTLIGLPLIKLVSMLAAEGVDVLAEAARLVT